MCLEELSKTLSDSEANIADRFRALFELKHIGNELAIDAISANFDDKSVLLRHELAYCLGQIQHPYAIEKLVQVLSDKNQHHMVRHEAAEALAAIGKEHVFPTLEKYAADEEIEVAETCQIGVESLRYAKSIEGCEKSLFSNIYNTKDPAPSAELHKITELEETLLNRNEKLFDRYRAMFALRNLKTDEAALALCRGFSDSSALFKHEIAFVLGQLQNPLTIPHLEAVLRNEDEHVMVRHECAEALGSIGTERCIEILRQYLNDKEDIIRESCEVALHMAVEF